MAPRPSVPPVEPSPSDLPSPSDELTTPQPARGLMFATPTQEPAATTSDQPAGDWPSPDEPGSDELPTGPSGGPRTSSKGSSGSALSRRAVRDAARQAVLMAGAVAHQVLARDEAAQAAGLFLADGDDAEAIGDPLASIANRHNALGAAGNPDLTDAIAALIGLALYAAKQLAAAAAARDLRARQAPQPVEEPAAVPEPGPEPDPASWATYGG